MIAWGYVMWDATRLISMGAKEVLELQQNHSLMHIPRKPQTELQIDVPSARYDQEVAQLQQELSDDTILDEESEDRRTSYVIGVSIPFTYIIT
jgi:hypothetical protein